MSTRQRLLSATNSMTGVQVPNFFTIRTNKEKHQGNEDMEGQSPSRLLILPDNASPNARICTLAHPRTGHPSRYYFDPEKGVYEFTRIAATKAACRSWLIAPQIKRSRIEGSDTTGASNATENPAVTKESMNDTSEKETDRPRSEGYVMKNAELLVATPIDYLYLLLPALSSQSWSQSPLTKGLFLSAEDLLDNLTERSKHFNLLLSHGRTRNDMEVRMQHVCDTVDAGDILMYRLNETKLLNELITTARRMVESGLPASMEQKFVSKALEIPVMSIKREDSSFSESNPSQTDTPMSEATSTDSQASAETVASAKSNATGLTTPDDLPKSDGVDLHHLLRLQTALSYLLASYIPRSLATSLKSLLASSNSPIDFKPLEARLAQIASLRAEALALRSLGDFSRKRNMHEDDDAAESRAGKKRRMEEEEKRKKLGESRGVRDLKKVDVKGMKKVSDFFGKKQGGPG